MYHVVYFVGYDVGASLSTSAPSKKSGRESLSPIFLRGGGRMFTGYVSAKFQLFCFSIYRDITDLVFLQHTATLKTSSVISNLHDTKSRISLEREKISK